MTRDRMTDDTLICSAALVSHPIHLSVMCCRFFFFNDTATTEIYTLSLHDALPISSTRRVTVRASRTRPGPQTRRRTPPSRSEEHTSELQSRLHLVCRLLLEKKKKDLKPAISQAGTVISHQIASDLL